ncbi:Ig-like domain-containing protein [Pseudomonas sp. LB3P14]
MTPSAVSIAVVDGRTIIQALELRTSKHGEPLRIKAIEQGKYILAEGEKGFAPENITVKRVGKDLHISLEGTDLDQPQLIIEGFYDTQSQVVGMAEDGTYYPYVASDAEHEHEVAFLMDDVSAPQVLGVEALNGFGHDLVALAGSGILWPSVLGLGALGLIGLGVAATRDDGGSSQPAPPPEIVTTPEKQPEIGTVTDNVGDKQGLLLPGDITDDTTPTFSGTGTPGAELQVTDNGKEIGKVVVDENGNWEFTPEMPLDEGQHVIVIVPEKGGEPSDGFELEIDTKAPSQVVIDSITDDVGVKIGVIANHGQTDDATPTLSGRAEPDSLVSIFVHGQLLGTTLVDANGNWQFTPTALADGEYVFTAHATDAAGNIGLSSLPYTVTIDTVSPQKPGLGGDGHGISDVLDNEGSIQGSITNGGVTDDTTPTLVGKGEPGDTVTLIDNGKVIGEVVVDDEGEWTFTPNTEFNEGQHDLTAVITDPAGNSSLPSDPWVIHVDTTAPVNPGVENAIDDVGSIVGPIKTGETTDDNKPTLGGSSEPGATVTIIDDGKVIGEVVVDDNGQWTFTPETALEDGEHGFTVVITDPAGNASDESDPFIVIVDTVTPGKPSIESVFDDVGDVQGNLKPGDITDDNKPTISGKAEANGTVVIYDKGVEIGHAPVDDKGQWTFTPSIPLSHGEHKLVVEAVDAAGNASEKSDVFAFEVFADGAPAAPAITAVKDDVGSIKGNIQKEGVTDDARPTLEGTAEAGTTVSIYSNGKLLGTVEADVKGNWSFTPDADLKDGLHNITATATNSAGNTSPSTGVYPITVDTTAPGTATAELSDDVGAIQGPIVSGDITDDNTPTFSGKSEANSTVIIYDQGVEIGRVPADDKGNWSFTPSTPLVDGGHSLSTAVQDKAGNLGKPSVAIDFTVDTSTVDISIARIVDDFGSKQGNLASGDVTDDSTPTLHGKATANSTVNIYDGKVLLGSTQSNGKGEWSFTPTQALAEGKHSLTATVVTAAGGESAPTAVFDLTIDITAPGKAIIGEVLDDVGAIQGPIVNGGSTDDTTPTLSGSGEPGSTVHIYDNDSQLGSVEVDDKGNWSFTPSPLNNGEHSFTVTNEDQAGNVSAPSDAYVVTVDTVAPVKPSIESVFDDVGDVQGNLKPGDITDDNKPTISGKAEANGTVVIYDKGVEIGRAPVDDKGQWTFTPAIPLSHGEHKLVVEAVDAAGNASEKSDAFAFEVFADGAPAAPAITAVKDDVGSIKGNIQKEGVTDDARPTLEGTAEAGTTVSIYSNGKLLGTVEADVKGNWSFTPDADLKDGLHNITATATNSAGNTSPSTGVYPITVDTTAPGTATAELSDDVGAIQGPIVSGDITDDNTPTFSGKSEANSTVIIYDQGVEIGRVPADDKGNWSFTPSTPLVDGGHSLSTAVQDKAGNLGKPSVAIDFTVDTSTVDISIARIVDDFGSKQGNLASGDVTDDSTPTLHGKATANSTVNIYDGKVLLGSTQSNGKGEWSFTPTQALAEGKHSLTATVVTAAGGESAPTAVFDLTIDITAPGKAIIGEVLDDVGAIQGPIVNGGSTDDTTPTLSGSGEPGSTVHIYDNDSQLGSVEVDDKGNWSFTPSPLNNGEHSFTVTNEDQAGNVSAPSDAYVVTVDTVTPGKPSIESVFDDVGDVQGNLKPGDITDDNKPTISGKAEANGTVVIYDKGVEIGRAPVDDKGQWTFTPAIPLSHGEHKLVVEAVDAAGNASEKSDVFAFEVFADGAPAAPAITAVKDDVGSIKGNIQKEGVTDDARPTLEGTAEAGTTVSIYSNGKLLGTVEADVKGNWSFTPDADLKDGLHNITATATNSAGNTSPSTGVYPITVDTTAPGTATAELSDDVGAIQGPIVSGDITDDNTPTFSGKSEANSTVIIYDQGVEIGRVPADDKGNWSFTPSTPLVDGGHSLSTAVQDKAGNLGKPSVAIDFTVDTSTVDISIARIVDDFGSKTGNLASGDVTDDSTPTLHGKATANSTVNIYDGKVLLGSTQSNGKGEWSFTPTQALAEGKHSLTATVVTAAGGESAPTAVFDLTIDITAPGKAIIGEVLDDVGAIQGPIVNGGSTDDTTPTLSGSGEPGSTVHIYDNDSQLGSVEVDDKGNWSFTPSPLNNGEHSFTVTNEDQAGNVSAPSDAYVVTVDTVTPGKPSIESVFDDVGDVQGNLKPGDITDDNKPTISGKAEANGTVVIYDKGVEIGRAPVDDKGQWTFTPAIPLSHGEHKLVVEAVDAAGNASEKSDAFAFEVFADGAPAAPAITAVKDDVGSIKGNIQKEGVTDDARPTLEGTAEAGTTVSIYSNGKLLGTVEADVKGNWSFTPDADLKDGLHNITATATNSAGNTSPSTGVYPITVDTTAPGTATAELSDDVGAIQGPIVSGDITDDNTPTFSGKSEANSTVIIYDQGVEIGRVPADDKGNWSFTPSTPLVDGGHSLSTAVQDKAGNLGKPSVAIDFTVDTSTVDISIARIVDDFGSKQGNLASGDVTDDSTPTLHGKATANSTVNIYDGKVLLGSTQSNGKGEWSFTPTQALAEGKHSLTATVVTAAGGESAPTAVFDLTIDITAPGKAIIGEVLDDVGAIQGPIVNGGSTDDTTPTLSGSGEPGSTVHIYDNDSQLGSVEVDDKGNWSFTPSPLNNGEHSFTVTNEDQAGNVSAPSDAYVVTVDTVTPGKPSIESVFDDVGDVQGNLKPGDITDDNKPTISGKAEANGTVVIYDKGVEIGRAPVDDKGQWTFTPAIPLSHGEHKLVVEAVDAAGNASEKSDVFAFEVFADGAPAAPAITAVKDDVGSIKGNIQKEGVTDDARPTLEGTAEAGTTVSIYSNGKLLGTVEADVKGNWSFTPDADLKDGLHNITATATNSAGNTSPSTGVYPITVDTTAPGTATAELSDDVGAIQGPIVSGDITDDNTPTFSGKSEANSTVIIYDQGVEIGRVPADDKGNWSFTPSTPLVDGGHSLSTAVQDKAGNLGKPSVAIDFTVDTSTVDISIARIVDDFGSKTGNLASGDVTDDSTPTLHGKATANSTVNIYDGKVLLGSTQSNGKGEWSFTPTQALAEGKHSLTATVVTAAGGESAPTAVFDLTIDITAPGKAIIGEVLDDVGAIQGPIVNGGSTDDTTPTLSGSGEPGSTVHIYDNDSQLGSVEVDDKGNWSFTPSPLNNGEHSFTVTNEDQAGNVSAPSDAYVVTVDTVTPGKPSIESVFDDVGDVQGNLKPGDITDDNKPTISGKAEANGTVVIYDKGVEIGRAPVDDKGQWTFTPAIPLSHGEHKLVVEAVDAAGNASEKSDAFAFEVFADGAPAAPAITAVKDDVGSIKGNIQKEGVTDDARPTLEGTAEAGTTVSIYSNGKLLGTVEADVKGNWSFTPDADLKDGLHNITATATNSAGNTSPSTGVYPITVDTTAPGTATAELSDDVGAIQGPIVSGDITDDNTPTFSGKSEANSTVIIYDQGVEIGRVPADDKGNWSFTPSTPLVDGGHSLSTAVQDKAGNLGKPSVAIDFTVDTSTVDISIARIVDDFGSKTGNLASGDVTDDSTPTLHGKATANSTVNIYDGKVLLGSTQSNGKGEWSFTPTQALAEGKHSLTATVVTAAGGESAPTAVFDLTIDITAPGKAIIGEVLDDVGAIQGPIVNGGSTDDTTPTLSGSGEPGSTVHIYDNDSQLGSVEVDDKGNWSFTPSPLNNGEHSFTVTNEDQAGNVSAPSDAYVVTVDTVTPGKPSIESVFDDVGDVQGNLKPGDITDDNKPTISGKAEANGTVVIYDKGVEIGRAPVDDKGQWTFTPAIPLSHGEHKLVVEAVDAAGNASEKSDVFAFEVFADGAPAAPTIDTVYDDQGSIKGNLKQGDVTDDTKPALSGKAEANSTVVIYDKGAAIGRTLANSSGNWTFTPSTALSEGVHTLTAKAIDAAGNASGVSNSFGLTVDTVAPSAPTIDTVYDDQGAITGNLKAGDSTDDNRPTLRGKAEANSTVVIYDKGAEIGRVKADAAGNWGCTPATALSQGAHTLTAKAIDAAGNASGVSNSFGLTVDTVAPSAPTIDTVYDDQGAITGNLKAGDSTDDNRPTLRGKAEANSTVVIYDKGAEIGRVKADAAGNWGCTPATALSQGAHTLTAKAIDAAGNTSVVSNSFGLTVDTVAPSAPTIDTVYDDQGSIKGNLKQGDVTDDSKPALSGKAEANSTVVIYDKGAEIGRVKADAAGNWGCTPATALSQGAHTLTAKAIDAAGNASGVSNSFGLTVDTVAPSAPTIDTVYDDQGSIKGNLKQGDVTDDSKPALSGKAEANSTVVIYDKGAEIGRVKADAAGNWGCTPATALSQGAHTLTAKAIDAAGNASGVSNSFGLTVDTVAPSAPTIDTVYDDQGAITGNLKAGDSTDDNRPTLRGKAEANSTVVIYDKGAEIGRVKADAAGNWGCTPATALSQGAHTLTAKAIDAAGNASGVSNSFGLTVDTVAPSAPTIDTVYDDQGAITGNLKAGDITDDNKPTLRGKAEANSTVVIYDKGTEIGRAKADASGNWTFTPATALSEGVHTLTAKAIDAAGNTSGASNSFGLTVDTVAPSAPTIDTVYDDQGAITGNLKAGDSTDDNRPTLRGKAETNSTVVIYDKGAEIGRAKADAAGNWTFTPATALSQGAHTLTAKAIDAAGHTSGVSNSFGLTVDIVAPSAPTIDTVYDDQGSIKGNLKQNDVTDDSKPALSGKAEANSTVVIYDKGAEIGRAKADTSGNWTFTPATALSEGVHTLTAKAIDAAGNTSGASNSFGLTVDTVAPTAPTIDTVYDDQGSIKGNLKQNDVTDDSQPALSGKAGANSTVVIFDRGTEIGRTLVNSSGNWTFTPATALSEGVHTLTAKAIDGAGNTSTVSNNFGFTVDTVAPSAPTIVAVYDDQGSVKGNLQQGDKTDDSKPTISGKAEAGSTVTIYDQEIEIGHTNADASGNWTFTPEKDLLNGAHSLSVKARDLAGNTSASSAAFKFDVVPPASVGYENFESQSLTPPSGVKILCVVGQYQFTKEGDSVDVPMGYGLQLFNNSAVRLTLPDPTDSFSFDYFGLLYQNIGAVLVYGVDGLQIGKNIYLTPNAGHVGASWSKVEFKAPSGTLISHIIISSGTDHANGYKIDNLKWGQGVRSLSLDDPINLDNSIFMDRVLHENDISDDADSLVLMGRNIDARDLLGHKSILDLSGLVRNISDAELEYSSELGEYHNALSLSDVLEGGGRNLFINDDQIQMMVKGNVGDTVQLEELLPDGTDPGDWALMGDVTVAGVVYNTYQHSTLDAEVLVQQGVTVNLV